MLGGRKNPEIEKLGNDEIGTSGSIELGTRNEEPRKPPEERRTTNYQLQTVPPFEIHVISCTQRPLRAPEKIAPNIWHHSLHVPKIGWLRTGYQGCIREVRRKLREIDPDIVHGQGTERDCAISAVLSGYPNVLTIHGNMRSVARALGAKPGSFYWLAGKLERFALARTRGVFCNSEYTRSMVGTIAADTWLVPNALCTAFFANIPSKTRGKDPLLLSAGTISPYKQQLECLGMMSRLHRKGHRFVVNFVGSLDAESNYGKKFLQEIRKAEKMGYARYLGNIGVQDLIDRLDDAVALVHVPSEEAFGLVVAEALARNVRVFGFSVGGMPDIARGIEGAELMAPHDWEGLEGSISLWISKGAKITENSAETMRLRYHPEVIARRHLEIYSQVAR